MGWNGGDSSGAVEGGRGEVEETLGNYFTDESERGERMQLASSSSSYPYPLSSFHSASVSGGLMLIHTNWLHYSRFIHPPCLFSFLSMETAHFHPCSSLVDAISFFLLISHPLI